MDLLRDRAVIVTGGAQGIGLATVATFLREGARVSSPRAATPTPATAPPKGSARETGSSL